MNIDMRKKCAISETEWLIGLIRLFFFIVVLVRVQVINDIRLDN